MGNIKCLPQGFKQGMAAELGNLVYVAFRGTETIGDWLAKLDFIQTGQQHGWGRTERGFSGVYAGSALTIIGALRNAGNPTHVFVVGHSLGGSLATLCAADIRASLAANTTLYAFASPRTGDPAFAARFNTECPDTWRIVNTEDIVNTVPLAATAVEELHLTGWEVIWCRPPPTIRTWTPTYRRARDLARAPRLGEVDHVGGERRGARRPSRRRGTRPARMPTTTFQWRERSRAIAVIRANRRGLLRSWTGVRVRG